MDKVIYTVLRIFIFNLMIDGDNSFVIELVDEQGISVYALLYDTGGNVFNINVGDRNLWNVTGDCRLYDSLELVVKAYCEHTDIALDTIWPQMSKAINISYTDEQLGVNDNALIMNDITNIPTDKIYDVAISMYKQTVDQAFFLKRALDGLATLKGDLSLSLYYLDQDDVDEAKKTIQLAMSYVGELSDDHTRNRMKKLRERTSPRLEHKTESDHVIAGQIKLYNMVGYSQPCRWSSERPDDCIGCVVPCNVCIASESAQAAYDHYEREANFIPAAIKKVLGKG